MPVDFAGVRIVENPAFSDEFLAVSDSSRSEISMVERAPAKPASHQR